MALIHVSKKTLCRLGSLKEGDVEDVLTRLGIPLEAEEGDDLSLEITPNRPDWLSVEGIARAAHAFKSGKPKPYPVAPATVHWKIDASVRAVRPVFGSAVVRGVKMTPELLQSLLQLQEKLHDTLGRGRSKMAIGLHDMAAIHAPFTYQAVGREDIRFVPLGKETPMTCGQILLEHEKGIAYAHLVGERCPLITDAHGEVLSFPPIINGERTRVTEESQDLLIDCTGFHAPAVSVTVSILAAALADHGGTVEAVLVDGHPYPVLKPTSRPLPLKEANALLGLELTADELSRHLRRMGHEVAGHQVHSPAWRADLMHAVDLIEDVAISLGYNELPPLLPSFSSQGHAFDDSAWHLPLLGLGYFEALSWILMNQRTLERARFPLAHSERVSNPLTEDFTTLRPALYPNLIEVFSRSKSEPMPQHLYEVGPVHEASGAWPPMGAAPSHPEPKSAPPKFAQTTHLCAASTHPKAGLSESVAHLKGLLRARRMECALEPLELEGFIPGRCARVVVDGKPVGFVGEVHPSVLEAFGLEQPVALFELSLPSADTH